MEVKVYIVFIKSVDLNNVFEDEHEACEFASTHKGVVLNMHSLAVLHDYTDRR